MRTVTMQSNGGEIQTKLVELDGKISSTTTDLLSGKVFRSFRDHDAVLEDAITRMTKLGYHVVSNIITVVEDGPYEMPIQPLHYDDRGTLRFVGNTLVRYLLDNGGLTLNDLCHVECTRSESEQFAQLIGYSVGGFSDLSYVREETLEKIAELAEKINNEG